jgi:hypothetical protein
MAETRQIITRDGRELQVHVAPWADDAPDAPKHVHVQDLAGGAGQILHFDSLEARALARQHPELAELGWSSAEEERVNAEREAAAQAEQRAAEQHQADVDAAVQRSLDARRQPTGPPQA